jgi:hypothetical protein
MSSVECIHLRLNDSLSSMRLFMETMNLIRLPNLKELYLEMGGNILNRVEEDSTKEV